MGGSLPHLSILRDSIPFHPLPRFFVKDNLGRNDSVGELEIRGFKVYLRRRHSSPEEYL